MALYAIADLHLSLGTDKPMDVFRGWENYVERLEKNWRALVTEEDTVVIAGDISWGMRLEETVQDFTFLESLPGKKLLLKGNHDYWWSTRSKIEAFFAAQGFCSMELVFNSAVRVGDITVCGTRGWLYNAETPEDRKIVARENGRLTLSPRGRAEARRHAGGVPPLPARVRYGGVRGAARHHAALRRDGLLLRPHPRRPRSQKGAGRGIPRDPDESRLVRLYPLCPEARPPARRL